MEELEALKEVQHNCCEMAERHYAHADKDEDSMLLSVDLVLARENVEWAYQLGKIIDKLGAEI